MALVAVVLVLHALAASATATEHVPISQIAKVVTAFAKTQGCMFSFDRKNIVPMEFEGEQSFIVLYSIDVGCSGGTGMTRPAIAVLARNYQGEVFVRPQYSAPTQTAASLPRLVERIFLKEGRLWYSGKDFDPRKDALCCPSVSVSGPLSFAGHQWSGKP